MKPFKAGDRVVVRDGVQIAKTVIGVMSNGNVVVEWASGALAYPKFNAYKPSDLEHAKEIKVKYMVVWSEKDPIEARADLSNQRGATLWVTRAGAEQHARRMRANGVTVLGVAEVKWEE